MRDKPKTEIWYHGTKEKFTEPLKPLYLIPAKVVAKMYGPPRTFSIDSNAKWLDMDENEILDFMPGIPAMDSIGYDAVWPEKLKNKGWDVVWDSADYYRGQKQIYVLNPTVLTPLDEELVEIVESLTKIVFNRFLK